MLAAALHQWRNVAAILQRLVNEQQSAAAAADAALAQFRVTQDSGAMPAEPPAAARRSEAAAPRRSLPVDGAEASGSSPRKRHCPDVDAPAARACALGTPARASVAAVRERGPPAGQGHQRESMAAPEAEPRRLDGAGLTWLISQLMCVSEPGDSNRHIGQPCVSMRDRILSLLRPMMNFQEKVVYFQEEQDRRLDYHLSEFGDDETLHIEVRRGAEVLGDTMDQVSNVADDHLMRELTVAFVGEDGEDGGGLLKEFCQACLSPPSSCHALAVPVADALLPSVRLLPLPAQRAGDSWGACRSSQRCSSSQARPCLPRSPRAPAATSRASRRACKTTPST